MIKRISQKIYRNKKIKKQKKIQQEFLHILKQIDPKDLIILDLGFNVGEVFNLVSSSVQFDMYYGFEMQENLALSNEFLEMEKLKLIHAAVIDSDAETVNYYEPKTWSHHNLKEGATIKGEKLNSSSKPITAPAIRLSSWINENISPEKILVLKIDIEGAEYQVLEDLLSSNIKPKINAIAVEWHCAKFGIENEAQYLSRKNVVKISCWQQQVRVLDWF